MEGPKQSPPAPYEMQQKYLQSKQEFEAAFKDFHKQVFTSKVLNVNKSTGVKNTETHMVDRLVNAAVGLEMANVGEGLLALITVVLRELLTMRDRANDIDYELCKAVRDLNRLKSELGVADGKKK